MSCEDQALAPTKHCTQCRVGFDGDGKPIYPELKRRHTGFWCCPVCGGSYGSDPHPDLRKYNDEIPF